MCASINYRFGHMVIPAGSAYPCSIVPKKEFPGGGIHLATICVFGYLYIVGNEYYSCSDAVLSWSL